MPTRHPGQFICRCRYFLRLHGHSCRKNDPGSSSALAPVQTFEPRRVLPSCVVNSAGEITVATPHEWRHL